MIAPVRVASPPPLKGRMLGPRGPFFVFFFFLGLDDVHGDSTGSKVREFQFRVPPLHQEADASPRGLYNTLGRQSAVYESRAPSKSTRAQSHTKATFAQIDTDR